MISRLPRPFTLHHMSLRMAHDGSPSHPSLTRGYSILVVGLLFAALSLRNSCMRGSCAPPHPSFHFLYHTPLMLTSKSHHFDNCEHTLHPAVDALLQLCWPLAFFFRRPLLSLPLITLAGVGVQTPIHHLYMCRYGNDPLSLKPSPTVLLAAADNVDFGRFHEHCHVHRIRTTNTDLASLVLYVACRRATSVVAPYRLVHRNANRVSLKHQDPWSPRHCGQACSCICGSQEGLHWLVPAANTGVHWVLSMRTASCSGPLGIPNCSHLPWPNMTFFGGGAVLLAAMHYQPRLAHLPCLWVALLS